MVLVLFLGVAVGLWLTASYVLAHRLTRRARHVYEEPIPVLSTGHIESFRLSTDDGEELGAWFLAGRDDQPIVVLLHGNGGDRGTCLDSAKWLSEEGCSVLLVTLRAHGDSTGTINDFGYSARHDVAAVIRWIEDNYPGRSIVLWGKSLGSAAALFAAGELGNRVSGYILECPYQNLRTAVRNRTRIYLPRLIDGVAYLGLIIVSPLVLSDIDTISPLAACDDFPVGLPVLVLAGANDQRARPDEARRIAERLGPSAELVVIEGGNHGALEEVDPQGVRQAVVRLLARSKP